MLYTWVVKNDVISRLQYNELVDRNSNALCAFLDYCTSTRGSVLFSCEIYDIEIVDGFNCDGDRLPEEMRAAATTKLSD